MNYPSTRRLDHVLDRLVRRGSPQPDPLAALPGRILRL